jgi:glycosyltransferase involved in cell wall biosynthesis
VNRQRQLNQYAPRRGLSSLLDDITPLVISFDEAPNIVRTFDKLRWARRIVVIDSGSTDGTIELLRAYNQVDLIYHPFTDFASQWNFGLTQISTRWVLSLDADYQLSDEIISEIQSLSPAGDTSGYSARFVYRVYGHPLRGAIYPPRIVLYKKEFANYKNVGHTQQLVVVGNVLPLISKIYHDDRKPLARWFRSQQRYANDEALYLLGADPATLSISHKLRLAAWAAPIVVFVYTLIIKGCVLDGWPGWFYVLQRVFAETMIALEIIDKRVERDTKHREG